MCLSLYCLGLLSYLVLILFVSHVKRFVSTCGRRVPDIDFPYFDILDKSVPPTLWQELGKDPFLFQHENVPHACRIGG